MGVRRVRTVPCRIKICGVTREKDIEAVNIYKPDYVGFVFAASRRRVTHEKASQLISKLDKGIKKVGIFVNHDRHCVEEIAGRCSLDVLQFHGNETSQYCVGFKQEVWKALGVDSKESLMKLDEFKVGGILVDSMNCGNSGGTGKTFEWEVVCGLSEKYKIILAGGLNTDNVIEAINKVRPYCVDVSSGVESDGAKDPAKIEKFIKTVRGEWADE